MSDRLPYALTEQIGRRARIGLIALQPDETVEHELRRMIRSDDVALFVTRIPSGEEVTPETLAAMEAALPAAAALLPPSVAFDAVGYACTSGSMQIGTARIAELVRGATDARAVTEPLSALTEALAALNVRRIALISPYIAPVAAPLREALRERGVETVAFGSFEERVETRVARIDPASTREAALQLGRREDVDGVLLSCTNLRTFDIIEEVEAALGKPVFSSNQALAWRLADLCGAHGAIVPPGRLGATPS
ncbi:MAG: Asp/Glu racemase [Pseudomonadota bacterium]